MPMSLFTKRHLFHDLLLLPEVGSWRAAGSMCRLRLANRVPWPLAHAVCAIKQPPVLSPPDKDMAHCGLTDGTRLFAHIRCGQAAASTWPFGFEMFWNPHSENTQLSARFLVPLPLQPHRPINRPSSRARAIVRNCRPFTAIGRHDSIA